VHRQLEQPETPTAARNFIAWIAIPVRFRRVILSGPATESNDCDSADFRDAPDQPQWHRFYDVRPAVGRSGAHEDDDPAFLRGFWGCPAHRRTS